MTFDDYWLEVKQIKVLPNTAIQQLPMSLSAETQMRLMRRHPEETVEILKNAIYEIDHGSVESIDSLVRKKL